MVLHQHLPIHQQLNEETTITWRKTRSPPDFLSEEHLLALAEKIKGLCCNVRQELQTNDRPSSRKGSWLVSMGSCSTSVSCKIKVFSALSDALAEGKGRDHRGSQTSAKHFQTFSKASVRSDLRSTRRLYSVPQHSHIWFVSYPAFTEETPQGIS